MTLRRERPSSGFTLVELLVVLLVIGLMALTLLPALAREKQRVRRMQCVDNLKAIGLAFKQWEFDHATKSAFGEQPIRIERGRPSESAVHRFEVMSNELAAPERLVCPSDSRVPANSFALLSGSNVSYFAGICGKSPAPCALLAGDRNLKSSSFANGGVLELTSANFLGWGVDMHRRSGNILLGDGSVELFSAPELKKLLEAFPATNRLALP